MSSIEGWLEKKGGFVGIWHKRYCTLGNNVFNIYKGCDKKNLTRTFIISPNTIISVLEKKNATRFSIQIDEKKTLMFQAKTRDEEIKWLNACIQAIYPSAGASLDDFEILSVIGRGFYGKVSLARHKETGKLVAIKSIHKKDMIEKGKVSTVITEREILMRSNSPYIVNLLFSFQTPSKFYLVIEYASGGDLFRHLHKYEKLPFDQVQLYIAEIALAINNLHENNIIYRDLKPENILFCKDGHLKLTDFGISKILADPHETTKTICGTSEYLAPEVISGQPYSFSVDWWQLGILMYELIVGRTPFAHDNKSIMYKNITTRSVGLYPVTDQGARELISMLLRKKPETRATFDDIKNSKFFVGFDWVMCEAREITPPYVPSSSSYEDLSNFDPLFTSENPCESMVMPVTDRFDRFSFTSPDIIA